MNEKKTAAVIINSSSGLYSFRKELLEALLQEHYEVVILAKDTGRMEELTAIGCRCIPTDIEFHGTDPRKELRLLRFYKNQLRELRPSVVLTYTIKPNVYGGLAAAALGLPCIANITGLGDAMENRGPMSVLTKTLYRRGLKKDRKVFFQNQSNREFFLANDLYRGPTELLPGSGVNLSRFELRPYPEQPEGKPLILSVVGRITRDKGFSEILEAAQALRDKPVLFRFIGSCNPELQEALTAAEASGNVRFCGLQRNMLPWYEETHAVLHASYHEGMSNVLLEAAACGRPVLATDVPGCRETFVDGVSGFGFPAHDAQALKEAVLRLLSLSFEQRRQMGLMGRKHVEEHFDRNRIIDAYLREIHVIEREKD